MENAAGGIICPSTASGRRGGWRWPTSDAASSKGLWLIFDAYRIVLFEHRSDSTNNGTEFSLSAIKRPQGHVVAHDSIARLPQAFERPKVGGDGLATALKPVTAAPHGPVFKG